MPLGVNGLTLIKYIVQISGGKYDYKLNVIIIKS